MIVLTAATEEDFEWFLGGPATRKDLRLPDEGLDRPETLHVIRDMTRQMTVKHGRGTWLIVSDREIVGLCGYKNARDPFGEFEIGFGIAPSRRRRGYATAAVAALVAHARADSAMRSLTAETAVTNLVSQRVLERNGFAISGERTDPADGRMLLWKLVLSQGNSVT
jgi:RimJ/RimL family protein N-acetyltransferase